METATRHLIYAILALAFAHPAFAVDTGEAILRSMDGEHMKRGTVTYKKLSDFPPEVAAGIKADNSNSSYLKTKSGVTYKVMLNADGVTDLIGSEESRRST